MLIKSEFNTVIGYFDFLKMANHMKFLLILLNIFCSLTLLAANKLAIINDPDGYTNVRSGRGTNFKVVDTLFAEDFFYFEPADKSGWSKVSAWKGKQIEGFVHKSKIQEVSKLTSGRQKELITKILYRQKLLADNYQKAWLSGDSLSYRKSMKELEYHSEVKYDPALNLLPEYFCSTVDTEIIGLLITAMNADKSSASESPSFAIGRCYACRSNIVGEQVGKLKNDGEKKQIFDQIEWGLLNHFEVNDAAKSTNKEFNKLKVSLDNARKESGL